MKAEVLFFPLEIFKKQVEVDKMHEQNQHVMRIFLLHSFRFFETVDLATLCTNIPFPEKKTVC